MRLTLLISLAFLLNLANSANIGGVYKSRWTSYKVNNGLKFDNSETEAKAFASYSANLDFIDQWNNDPTKTSKLGENHLTHLSTEEMKKRILMPPRSISQPKVGAALAQAPLAGVRLQSLVNYTYYFGPIKDQGYCGSCYAFTTAGVVEGQYSMKYGQKISLSEQQILDCTSKIDGANQGCNGGDNLFSLAYIRQVGLCSEETYSYSSFYDYYDVMTGMCQASTIASCKPVKIKNYGLVSVNNEQVMAAYLQVYGPFTIYIDASARSFQSYKSGVYYEPGCSSYYTDHTMVAVGFGTDEKGNDYWILRNSWGESWGMKGYMHLARNKNGHCGVASSPYYAKF